MSSLCQAFIFDFNTVFKENHGLALKQLDKLKLFKYTARGRNPYDLMKKLEEFLVGINGMGVKRATVLEDWLKGNKSSVETLEFIQRCVSSRLKENPSSTTFALLNEVVEMTFKPQNLSKIMQVNNAAIEVADKLLKDNRRVYLAGNIDKDTFEYMKQQHPKTMSKFKDCFLSYECKSVKPEKEFMDVMKAKWSLQPIKTCIIDDDTSDVKFLASMGYNVFPVNTMNKLY